MAKRLMLSLCAAALLAAGSAMAAGEKIDWQVIAGGGGDGSSTNYRLSGTIGQTATGLGTSASYAVNQGYWQNFSSASCCDKRGDADNSGAVNVGDLTFLVNYLFKGGPAPICNDPGASEGDADGNGALNVGDLTYMVNYLFKGGPAPIPCP